MIRLNCSLILEVSENRKPLIETAMELIELSLREKGCIDYDFYVSLTNDDRYEIVETWKSQKDLNDHKASEHFLRLVPKLQSLATVTIEQFDF